MDGENGGVVLGLAAMEEARTESKSRSAEGRWLQSVRRPETLGRAERGMGWDGREEKHADQQGQWYRMTAALDQTQQETCASKCLDRRRVPREETVNGCPALQQLHDAKASGRLIT